MKLSSIIILSALFVTINGAWFVGLVQPILMTFGATFAALNFDLDPLLDMKPNVWKAYFDPRSKEDELSPLPEHTDSEGRRYVKNQEGEKYYVDEIRPEYKKEIDDYNASNLDNRSMMD